jgi:hypothetical protein
MRGAMLGSIPLDVWAAALLALAVVLAMPNPAPAIVSAIYFAIWVYIIIKTCGDEAG